MDGRVPALHVQRCAVIRGFKTQQRWTLSNLPPMLNACSSHTRSQDLFSFLTHLLDEFHVLYACFDRLVLSMLNELRVAVNSQYPTHVSSTAQRSLPYTSSSAMHSTHCHASVQADVQG
jgi:PHP family Zn ribbon phosphoesterase